jgi:hypothetical protein
MRVTMLTAALWGLFGGFAVEGLELYTAVRRYGRWPWQVKGQGANAKEPSCPAYIVAELIRLAIGAGLAWAAQANHQITGPFGAIAVGAAAPVIIGQLAKGIPLGKQAEEPAAEQPELAAKTGELPAGGEN